KGFRVPSIGQSPDNAIWRGFFPVPTPKQHQARIKMAKSSKPKEIVVVGSKIKEAIKEAGLPSYRELVQAVSGRVHELLSDAINRCKGNNRSTVRPYDL